MKRRKARGQTPEPAELGQAPEDAWRSESLQRSSWKLADIQSRAGHFADAEQTLQGLLQTAPIHPLDTAGWRFKLAQTMKAGGNESRRGSVSLKRNVNRGERSRKPKPVG